MTREVAPPLGFLACVGRVLGEAAVGGEMTGDSYGLRDDVDCFGVGVVAFVVGWQCRCARTRFGWGFFVCGSDRGRVEERCFE